MIDSYRRDETSNQQYNNTLPPPQPTSPPTSASPFAFAPPPLSSLPGPGSRTNNNNSPASFFNTYTNTTTMHQADQTTAPVPQDYSSYYPRAQPPPQGGAPGATNSSYPAYAGSHPLGYRTVSGATDTTRAPPPPPLRNVPAYSAMQSTMGSQPSPTASSPYGYPMRSPAYASSQPSPRGGSLAYQQAGGYYSPYGQPQALDMPRSLSYPNTYTQPYTTYLPSISTPTLVSPDGLPSLHRHGSTPSIATVGGQPPMGYAFASRLPLTERPFKCDQCVQSFNRNHDLKRHKRIHLSVKPFHCDKCGKTFSRKDALRRHWMVRGCRGEDGATAPITPTFNPNGPPPELSPGPESAGNTSSNNSSASTAPSSNPAKLAYGTSTMSFNHPSAPPPLSSLPPRQSSDQPSQILLTPNEMASKSGMDDKLKLDSVNLDSAMDRNPETPTTGYFETGRKDSLGGIPESATSSTFSRYANSPKDDMRHHPYRRALPSPSALSAPPIDGKPLFDNKPVFNMTFQGGPHSLLTPNDDDMNKDNNGSPDTNWARPW